MQNIKTIFLGITCNLITPLLVSIGGIAVVMFYSFSYELNFIIINIALSLSIIILILNHHFSNKRIRVLRTLDNHPVYLIEKNVARHIPDPETFNYLGQIYGFDWKDIESITNNEFSKQFSTSSILPSIKPHCEAFHKQIMEQNVNNE